LNDITDLIYYNLENTLKIQSNHNTLEVITTMREPVYSNKERSVGQPFGFRKYNSQILQKPIDQIRLWICY